MSILREIKDVFRFLRTDKNTRPIVFYAEDVHTRGYYEGLIDELTKNRGVAVHYVTSQKDDPVLKRRGQLIVPYYVNKLLQFIVRLCDSKVLVMTMPDLETFHIKRSKFDTNHVYLFHNIGSAFTTLRHGALFHYDTVLCVGEHHVEELERQREVFGTREQELLPFGYYRLEKIHRQYREFAAKKKASDGPSRILFAPSWGEDSSLALCGREVVAKLLDAGHRAVLRPHPMSLRQERDILDPLLDQFSGNENFIFENDINMLGSILESETVVTDWSGIMYEFAFGTERPVLFIDTPQKIKNPRHSEYDLPPIEPGLRHEIGLVVAPDDLDRLPSAVEELSRDRESYVKAILKARDTYIFNFGNSSPVGADHLMRLAGIAGQ